MANEIIALQGARSGNRYDVLMIFPLAPAKIKQVGGVNVVPTPSSGLSATVRWDTGTDTGVK